VLLALQLPLLPTTSVTPYFLRSSDPSTNFVACPSARPCPFLLDFDLRETFFRKPHSRVLFFGRLQYRNFLDDFNTVRHSGDLHHNIHIFSSDLFLLGPGHTVLSKCSLLWECIVCSFQYLVLCVLIRALNGPYLILFFFYVAFSSACIHLISCLPHL